MSRACFVLSGPCLNDSSPRWRAEFERLKAAVSLRERPFVTVSFAVSADLCLSNLRGAPSRVSSEASLQVTHALRASHEALVVGVGTVLTDDPILTTRMVQGPSPTRVVLDSRLRVPASARLLRSTPEPALLMTSTAAPLAREQELRDAGAVVVRVEACEEGVTLPSVLAALHARGVKSVMVEGGVEVLESFFAAGLIDFLAVTFSPQHIDSPSAVRLGPLARAALAAWEVPTEVVGVDTLRSGALHAALRVAS